MFKTKKYLRNYEQAVSAMPDIYKLPVTEDLEFMVIGCDGIWDCVTPQILCDYISASLKENIAIKLILKKIFDIFVSKHPDGNL